MGGLLNIGCVVRHNSLEKDKVQRNLADARQRGRTNKKYGKITIAD